MHSRLALPIVLKLIRVDSLFLKACLIGSLASCQSSGPRTDHRVDSDSTMIETNQVDQEPEGANSEQERSGVNTTDLVLVESKSTKYTYGIVNDIEALLLFSPLTESRIVDTLEYQEELEVVKTIPAEDWYFVKNSEFEGWISKTKINLFLSKPESFGYYLNILEQILNVSFTESNKSYENDVYYGGEQGTDYYQVGFQKETGLMYVHNEKQGEFEPLFSSYYYRLEGKHLMYLDKEDYKNRFYSTLESLMLDNLLLLSSCKQYDCWVKAYDYLQKLDFNEDRFFTPDLVKYRLKRSFEWELPRDKSKKDLFGYLHLVDGKAVIDLEYRNPEVKESYVLTNGQFQLK